VAFDTIQPRSFGVAFTVHDRRKYRRSANVCHEPIVPNRCTRASLNLVRQPRRR
jgi:hypothetical protein